MHMEGFAVRTNQEVVRAFEGGGYFCPAGSINYIFDRFRIQCDTVV